MEDLFLERFRTFLHFLPPPFDLIVFLRKLQLQHPRPSMRKADMPEEDGEEQGYEEQFKCFFTVIARVLQSMLVLLCDLVSKFAPEVHRPCGGRRADTTEEAQVWSALKFLTPAKSQIEFRKKQAPRV